MSSVFVIAGNAGQGKSTVAVNLAAAFCSLGFDVLLVDADLKTPRVGYYIGMPLVEKTIQEILLGMRPLEKAIYQTASGIKLLLSSLNDVNTPHPSVLLPKLKNLADIILVDTPTNDELWKQHGQLVLVTIPDFPSVFNLRKQYDLKKAKLVVNRARCDSVDLPVENIKNLLNCSILGWLASDLNMREALRKGLPFVDLYPDSIVSNEFKSIAAKLMNVEYTSPVKKVSLLMKLGLEK